MSLFRDNLSAMLKELKQYENCNKDQLLKEYVSKRLIEMYGVKQLQKITELAKRIDKGDFNCKIIDGGRRVIPYNPYAAEDYLDERRDDSGPGGDR